MRLEADVIKGLLRRGRRPIGIDLGAHSIKMLQLANGPAGNVVAAAAKKALPADIPESGQGRARAIAELVRQAHAESRMAGRSVVCCLPSTSIQYKNLRLPKMPADELRAAVEWEAADRLKLDPKTTRFQFFDAGEVRQGDELRQEIILMAVPASTVDDYAEALAACGLQPLCFEAAPSALARSVGTKATDEGDEAARVILDVGFAASKVLVVRNGRVVFFKLIDIGGRALDECVAQRLKMSVSDASDLRRRLRRSEAADPATGNQPVSGTDQRQSVERAVGEAMRGSIDELSREVGLCVRYFSVTFRGRRPDAVDLVGGEAGEEQLVKLLADSAQMRVEPVLLGDSVDFSRVSEVVGSAGPLSEWSVATGLAMWRQPKANKRSAA